MNQSFLATIAFAVLALLGTLVANLIGWVITGSVAFQIGAIVCLVGAGLAYVSQHYYTMAACWLERASNNDIPPVEGAPEPYVEYLESFRYGKVAQWGAFGFAALSLICFLLGG